MYRQQCANAIVAVVYFSSAGLLTCRLLWFETIAWELTAMAPVCMQSGWDCVRGFQFWTETEYGSCIWVQSVNHWTTRLVSRIHVYLLGWRQGCPAQKEQQRQETPDFRTGRDIRGQREAAPRARGRPYRHTWPPHTVSICTYILGNSSFDHTSHINLREDSIQTLRWTRQKPPWELLLH